MGVARAEQRAAGLRTIEPEYHPETRRGWRGLRQVGGGSRGWRPTATVASGGRRDEMAAWGDEGCLP